MGLPKENTHPIECARKNCKWKGYEGDLAKVPLEESTCTGTVSVCPECGHDSYMFLTARQMKYWKMYVRDSVT